jgi:ABC-2 type transport system ATP-binding protein
MEAIINICDLSKTYISKERRGIFGGQKRAVEALKGVNLDIYPGEIFGLLGPNGAGKTTLIKCLTTLLLPTSGTAWVNGYQIGRDEDLVRASVGCMLMGERGLYWKLTGRENLDFFGSLYHIPSAVRHERSGEAIELLGLEEIIDRTVETYSSGQKMKLAFARALINNAPILILDEPTVTLDVPSARELRAIVKDLNQEGHTILYTTHQMAEAEELCHRVAIIDRGEIIALGTVDELKATLEQEGVIKVEGVIPVAAYRAVRALPMVSEAALTGDEGMARLIVVSPHPRHLLPELIRARPDGRVRHVLPLLGPAFGCPAPVTTDPSELLRGCLPLCPDGLPTRFPRDPVHPAGADHRHRLWPADAADGLRSVQGRRAQSAR